ncbi:MAG TPA: histidine kinase dimerization/phosphoacceptor domain -containing protein [Xanthobacteraceae bacterium]|nr:histidine kinase dimerization/phosphoacceptor domain -containing protein [Xanthobacteraceae bacterium]
MSESGKPSADTLARAGEYQRVLAAFSRVASEALPPERLMHHAVAQVSSVTHIKHVKIMRYRPDHGDLLLVAGVGWNPGVVGHATLGTDHRSPPGRSLQTGGPVIIEDLPHDNEYRYSDLLREHNVVSVLNVPIMIDSRTWGVLEVDTEERHRFDDWDVAFLTTLANMVGLTLARHAADERTIEADARGTREKAHAAIAVQELQHRVKNNLQLIIAFLTIKRREAQAPETQEKLGSVIARVQAIALAHDQLSVGGGPSTVDFREYLHALCANIDPRRPEIKIEVSAEPAKLPLDRAVPAGLVVNECVTNSIKYAFGEEGGTIRVTFAPKPNVGEACLSIEDDGKGMPSAPTPGLGLKLVEGFARQLGGRVEYERLEKGFRTFLRFPAVF